MSKSVIPFAIAIHGGAGTLSRSNLSAEQEQKILQYLANDGKHLRR